VTKEGFFLLGKGKILSLQAVKMDINFFLSELTVNIGRQLRLPLESKRLHYVINFEIS
jgi:hypothetical protein